MKRILLTKVIFYFIFNYTFAQSNVLFIDYNNGFSSDKNNNDTLIYKRLLTTQLSVDNVNSIPSSISNAMYDQVWIFGDIGTTSASILNPIEAFINGGGAVYVQSEVACCNNEARYVETLIHNLVINGSLIGHSNSNIKAGQYEFTTNIEASCTALPVEYGSAARIFTGVPANNIMFTATNTCGNSISAPDVMGVMFGSCDMVSGNGALVTTGDFNMLVDGGSCTGGTNLGNAIDLTYIDMFSSLMSRLANNCQSCPTLSIKMNNSSDFKATCNSTAVKLEWNSSVEEKDLTYIIEKAIDKKQFEAIAKIPSKQHGAKTYTFTDYSFEKSDDINYRLKLIYPNGNIEYNDAISVNCNDNYDFTISPNPNHGSFIVTFSNQKVSEGLQCSISDMLGHVIKPSYDISNNNTITIDLSNLAKGVYILTIESYTGPISKKLIID